MNGQTITEKLSTARNFNNFFTVFKSKSALLYNNYKPISFLSNVCKKNRNTDVQKANQVPRTRNMILQSSILFLSDCSTNNALTSKNIQTQMIVNMLQLFLFT